MDIHFTKRTATSILRPSIGVTNMRIKETLFSVGFVLALALFIINVNGATWYNANWLNMKPITISNVFGVPTSDYWMTVYIPVTYTSKMKTDFSDLVFTDSDNVTILPYCIDSKKNSDWANIYVNVSSITNKTIYMYYNNSVATSIENCGRAVWLSHNYLHNYTWVETAPESNLFTFDANNLITSTAGGANGFVYLPINSSRTIGEGYELKVGQAKSTTGAENDVTFSNSSLGGVNAVSGVGYEFNTDGASYYDVYRLTAGSRASDFLHTSWTADTSYHVRKDLFTVNGTFTSYLDGVVKSSAIDTTWLPNSTVAGWKYILLSNSGSGTTYYQNVSLRRVLPSAYEPVYTTGAEKDAPAGFVETLNAYINSPTNTTYKNTTIKATFYAISNQNTSYTIKLYDNATLIYNNSSYTNNTILNVDISKGSTINNLTVQANTATKTASANVYYTNDITAPVIIIPVNGSKFVLNLTDSKAVNINYTVTDNFNTISACWSSIDGGSYNYTCNNITFNPYSGVGNHTINIYANDTAGNIGVGNAIFGYDFLNQFNTFVSYYFSGSPYSNFNIILSNNTYSIQNNSILGQAWVTTSALPWGTNITATISGSGFSTTNFTVANYSSMTQLNTTFTVNRSGLLVQNVFDEQSLSALTYNISIFNSTYTNYSFGLSGSDKFFDYTTLPNGTNVQVLVQNQSGGYVDRSYFVSLNPNIFLTIRPYLLTNSAGNYITVFVYSDSEPAGSADALISARRYLSSSWVTVDQKLTDFQGKAYLFLYPFTTYQILASKGSESAFIPSYFPNPSINLNIKMNGTTEGVNVTIPCSSGISNLLLPIDRYINGTTTFDWFLYDANNDLEYYYIFINKIYNVSTINLFNNTITTQPNGGEILVNVNTTQACLSGCEYFEVLVGFKRGTYDECNVSRIYLPANFGPNSFNINYSITTALNDLKVGNFGITSDFFKSIIAVLISLGAGAMVGRYYNSFGGALVFITVMSLFAFVGFFGDDSLTRWGFISGLALIGVGFYAWRTYL